MRKKVSLFLISVFILFMFILSGCHVYFSNYDWSVTEKTKLKQDVNDYFGQSAVFYDGRVYYISQEKGDNGLYCMRPDGTDVMFECSMPRITRLILTQSAIYYIGLKKIEEGQKIFGLYKFDRDTKKSEEVAYRDNYEYEDVKDAYVAENGLICIIETDGINTSAPPKDITFITDSVLMPTLSLQAPYTYIKNSNIKYQSCEVLDHIVIDKNDNFIIGRNDYLVSDPKGPNPTYEQSLISDYGCSFYDLNNKEIIMDSNEMDDDRYFKVLYADDERILCSFNNELLEIDPETLAVTHDYKFDNTDNGMKIAFMFKAGDTIYAVFERNKSSNKDVYYLNLQTSKNGKISTFNDSKELLGVENGNILWVQGSVIHCSSLGENGIGNDIYSIKMPEDVVSNNIFEIAGDWLFIHRLSTTEETNQLLYKVNLKTQEINKVS